MSRLADGWDNDDVRVRPGRGSRPRTKKRPAHRDAVTGFVTTVDRGRYTCLVGGDRHRRDTATASYPGGKNATGDARTVTAMRARELRRRPIVVGDEVDLVGDISGKKDTLARIVRIGERRSVLRRSADDIDPSERVLVANADALMIVVAAADPPPRTGLIDRCLVAAYTGNLAPMMLITKTDLADPAEIVAGYRDLELSILHCGRTVPDRALDTAALDEIRSQLSGQTTALVGHSGVGKSTLVNALIGAETRATGSVTGVGKGRHTSSSAVALALPTGGWIVDTPGVRSFGLAHVSADDVLESFDDLLPASADCPPGCTHAGPGIGCAIDDAVRDGAATTGRLASFRRLLTSRTMTTDLG